MSKIGELQSALQTIFEECTPKFVNTMHSIQLEFKTEKKKRILVFVRVCQGPNVDKAVLKSAMYVREHEDLDFLRAYLAGLVLTLAVWYVEIFIFGKDRFFCKWPQKLVIDIMLSESQNNLKSNDITFLFTELKALTWTFH